MFLKIVKRNQNKSMLISQIDCKIPFPSQTVPTPEGPPLGADRKRPNQTPVKHSAFRK